MHRVKSPSSEVFSDDGFYKALLDHMSVGVIVSDADGRLIYINKTYAQFLNISIEESLGKHATEVVSNSRLHIVAKTGISEINYPHQFKDRAYLVHRVPIRREGKIIAVLGLVLFDSAQTAVDLAEKVGCLERKLQHYQRELASWHRARYGFDDIVAHSNRMRALKEEALLAASHDLPVLLTGESGTGKELFAHAIHLNSARRDYPFITVNCAGIPRELLESELFGYEKGAFTGAHPKGKPGKFEMAHRGTIFLDEIGDMPLEMQPKLLRVLETKTFERVGGTLPVESDFRLIAATNQNLDKMVRSGLFRRDLYYRLSVVPLEIPPLRDRPEDIVPMAYHFLQKVLKGPLGKAVRFRPEAEKALCRYDWPGNARELKHVLERIACNLAKDFVEIQDLPEYIRKTVAIPSYAPGSPLDEFLATAERHAILQALAQAGNNKAQAAKILGIHRTFLYKKMKKLGMDI
uniref:PAS domain-containing protein n=1 Tax=Desulfacinum infernum TaxID=35837 RepID=A0A831ZIS2_9BACT